jgi:hypothetical protein
VRREHHRTRRATFAALCATALTLVAAAALPAGATAKSVPTWKLTRYVNIGSERSFKTDLVDELHSPPQLVVFGGSRLQRFRPKLAHSLTGLSTMNFALSNFRPEDAWAVANYLLKSSPGTRLHCIWGVQVGMFNDTPLAPGLVYDDRLSQAFPPDLVQQQKTLLGTVQPTDLLVTNRFTARGTLVWSNYDAQRARGLTLKASLAKWINRYVTSRSKITPQQSRSRAYFEKTLKLLNDHGTVPCIVIMPYHPTALKALTKAGWRYRLKAMKAYLAGLHTTYTFHLLNYTTVKSFGGRWRYFYDGAHLTARNSSIMLRHIVKAAPESFK